MKAKKSKYFKAAKENTDKLVVYFSAKGFQANGMLTKGNTAILAEIIRDELHADLFELVSNDEHYPKRISTVTPVLCIKKMYQTLPNINTYLSVDLLGSSIGQ